MHPQESCPPPSGPSKVLGSRCVQEASCPFVAAPGAKPPRLAGRSAVLDVLGDHLDAVHAGTGARVQAWTGRVGSGRTVLAHEAAKRAAQQGWAPAIVTVQRGTALEHDLARGAAAALLHRGRRHPEEHLLGELLGVVRSYAEAHGLELPLEPAAADISWSGERYADAGMMLERLATALRGVGAGLFLVFDDLDHAEPAARRDLLTAAAELTGAGSAFSMVASALPGSLPDELVVTTAIGPLTPPELFDAVSWPAAELGVEVAHDTIAAIGRRTAGHPYFVQAFAREAWITAAGQRITPDDVAAVALPVERALKASFFAPVLDGLSPAEVRFVRAVADAGSAPTFAEVANRLGDPVRFDPATSRLAPVRDELLARGVLCRLEGDRLQFALPLFERYVHTAD